jgi:hypothetical protein
LFDDCGCENKVMSGQLMTPSKIRSIGKTILLFFEEPEVSNDD